MHTILLQSSGAIRASFLIQATALWTPILSTVAGSAPSRWQWMGSVIALCASMLVVWDQHSGSMSDVQTGFGLDIGDYFILASTVVYSMATVRIPEYTKKVSPVGLACGKSIVLAIISSSVLGYQLLHGTNSTSLWPEAEHQVWAWSYILWAAVGSGAASAYLHVKGQSMVTATDAQLVFSTVPLWSAIISAVMIDDERLGLLTWCGGAMMILAGLVSAQTMHNAGKNT